MTVTPLGRTLTVDALNIGCQGWLSANPWRVELVFDVLRQQGQRVYRAAPMLINSTSFDQTVVIAYPAGYGAP